MDRVTHRTIPAHQPLSVLAKVALGALIANACANIVPLGVHLFFTDGRLVVPLLVIGVLVLLCAGLVATGLRWMPVVGGLIAFVTAALDIAEAENTYALLHPAANTGHFVNVFVLLLSALVALAAGVGATWRADRHPTVGLR